MRNKKNTRNFKKDTRKTHPILKNWIILNICDYFILFSTFSYQSFWNTLIKFKISWFVVRTKGVELFSDQNDKLWQPMTVKIWNRLLNLPTNLPTNFSGKNDKISVSNNRLIYLPFKQIASTNNLLNVPLLFQFSRFITFSLSRLHSCSEEVGIVQETSPCDWFVLPLIISHQVSA